MKLKDKVIDRLKTLPLIGNVIEDYGFRTVITFVGSLIVNVIIAIFNAVTAILYSSIWFGSFAIYYIALSIERSALLISLYCTKKKYANDNEKYQKSTVKIYIANGIILILLDLALTLATIQIATRPKPIQTGTILAIANATYAFFKITMAIINIYRVRKLHDHIMQTMRNINLADACVSILALTSTLICTFGSLSDMLTMLIAASVGVNLIIITIGIAMVINGCLKLKNNINACNNDIK